MDWGHLSSSCKINNKNVGRNKIEGKKERKKRAHHGLDKAGKDTSFSRPIIVWFSSADAKDA